MDPANDIRKLKRWYLFMRYSFHFNISFQWLFNVAVKGNHVTRDSFFYCCAQKFIIFFIVLPMKSLVLKFALTAFKERQHISELKIHLLLIYIKFGYTSNKALLNLVQTWKNLTTLESYLKFDPATHSTDYFAGKNSNYHPKRKKKRIKVKVRYVFLWEP